MKANLLRLLVVDDDSLILDSIRLALPNQWQLLGVSDIKSIPNHSFDAAFVDIHLSGQIEKTEGLEVVKQLRSKDPHLEIVAMSGDLNRDTMEMALQRGASRFLAKPLSFDEVILTLDKIEALILLRQATPKSGSSPCWVGSSPISEQLRQRVATLSRESGPILIEGESGTGKEVVAALIHKLNPSQPMVSINVAAIPENLFESEFFGHVKGSFTGAEQNKMGLAEASHGGKLFLDEIEALSLSMQVKLLRFLESGEVRRVGAKESLIVKTQVIVATNKNLEALVAEEKFREDLLWRLNGKKIFLPPLRDRKEDIPELTRYFLSLDKARNKQLSPEAIRELYSYSWPGNVRELKKICEQLLTDSPLPLIRSEDVIRCLPSPPKTSSTHFTDGLQTIVNGFEAETIKQCLQQTKDIDETSKVLKISRSCLYKKIKDHKIEWRSQ